MAIPLERIRTAWATGESAALNREVERLAAEGESREVLEAALEKLLLELRQTGIDDESEENINGVWDRLTGWCHASRRIAAVSNDGVTLGNADAVPHAEF